MTNLMWDIWVTQVINSPWLPKDQKQKKIPKSPKPSKIWKNNTKMANKKNKNKPKLYRKLKKKEWNKINSNLKSLPEFNSSKSLFQQGSNKIQTLIQRQSNKSKTSTKKSLYWVKPFQIRLLWIYGTHTSFTLFTCKTKTITLSTGTRLIAGVYWKSWEALGRKAWNGQKSSQSKLITAESVTQTGSTWWNIHTYCLMWEKLTSKATK